MNIIILIFLSFDSSGEKCVFGLFPTINLICYTTLFFCYTLSLGVVIKCGRTELQETSHHCFNGSRLTVHPLFYLSDSCNCSIIQFPWICWWNGSFHGNQHRKSSYPLPVDALCFILHTTTYPPLSQDYFQAILTVGNTFASDG